MFDQLNIDPNKNEVFLFGDIEKGDENYSLLYEYIRNIKFGEISSTFLSFNEELNNVTNHRYFTLFSQLLVCIISGKHKGKRIIITELTC